MNGGVATLENSASLETVQPLVCGLNSCHPWKNPFSLAGFWSPLSVLGKSQSRGVFESTDHQSVSLWPF